MCSRLRSWRGTANAVTTTFTYEPLFQRLATVTDPLSHAWTLTYDATGCLTSATDPLTRQRTIVMNGAGQVTQVTDLLTALHRFADLRLNFPRATAWLGLPARLPRRPGLGRLRRRFRSAVTICQRQSMLQFETRTLSKCWSLVKTATIPTDSDPQPKIVERSFTTSIHNSPTTSR